jgi:hypothetical protein
MLAFSAFVAAQPDAGDDVPAGTPTRAAMAGWTRVSGDVETASMRVIYEFYVRPERGGLYTITRYRVTRKADAATGAGASDESEKYIWNEAFGRPLRCFAREKNGWRALEHATPEYQAEMLTAISVYALHRQATLPRR